VSRQNTSVIMKKKIVWQ
jgi:Beta galactosidase small chain.